MCRILRLKRNKPLLLHTPASRPTWRGVTFIGLRTRFVQRGRRAGCVSCVVKNTIRAASLEVLIRMPFQCNRQSSPDHRKPESIIPQCQAHHMTHHTRRAQGSPGNEDLCAAVSSPRRCTRRFTSGIMRRKEEWGRNEGENDLSNPSY